MKSSRRPSPRRKTRQERRGLLSHRDRRSLLAEALEPRMLLAGDVNYHNTLFPQDVDQNMRVTPRDALMIINTLNASGARELTGAASGAEGEASSIPYMYDVNNDGRITANDALRVINLLNQQEGESTKVMEIRTVFVQPGTMNPIPNNRITKGTDFEIMVIVQDMRGPDQLGVQADRGVFSASMDLLLNSKALADVENSELQRLRITGNPTGGTFTITYNDNGTLRTTGNIAYNPLVESQLSIANRIRQALEAPAMNIGVGNIEVVPGTAILNNPSILPTDYLIRFQGALGDRDLALLTANPAGLTGGSSPNIVIVEIFPGVENAQSFRQSLLRRYQVVGPQLIADYNQVITGADAVNPDRIDEVGGVHTDFLSLTFPDGTEADPRMLFRVRMNSLDAGSFSVAGDVVNTTGENQLYSSQDPLYDERPLLAEEIQITNPTALTIIEPFSANDDLLFVFNEDLQGSTSPATLNVTANDTANNATTGVPSGALPTNVVIVSTSAPSLGGLVTINTGGKTLSYTPAAHANGIEEFTYTLRNPTTGVTDTAKVRITLNPINDPPVNTVPGARTVAEDGVLTFPGNLSISDVDAGNNDVQTVVSVTNGTLHVTNSAALSFFSGNDTTSITMRGTITSINNALNGMTYRPNENYNGPDTLQIATSDLGHSPLPEQTDNDSVAINVTAVNDAPVIVAPGDQEAIETLETTLDPILVTDVDFGLTSPSNMEVALSVDGQGHFSLASTTGLNFTVGDGINDQAMTFTGNLQNINAALAGIVYVAGLGDAEGPKSLSITTNDNGSVGTGGPLSDSETITINVVPLDRPFARDDAFEAQEDSLAADNVIHVLDNDFKDADQEFVIVAFTQASHGVVTDNGDGTFSYEPNADFFGIDTFTYTINQTPDGKAPEELDEDQVATVTITVVNTPDAPEAFNDVAETDEDVAVNISVMANDRDIDLSIAANSQTPTSATHDVIIVTPPANGSVQVNANGTVTYTPDDDFNGSDSFTYQLDDGVFLSNVATVSITVDPVNDAPVANNDLASVDEDTFVDIAVLANDRDVDLGTTPATQIPTSATHTITVMSTPLHGSAVDNGDGTVKYTPNSNYFGPDSFTYRINDGLLNSNTATVSITVNNTPDDPIANNDSVVTFEDTALTFNVMANDRDVDLGVTDATRIPTAATHTVTIEVQPTNGTASVNPLNGAVTYTPNEDFQGDDSFVYRLTDSTGRFDTATVSVFVDDVNDAPEAFNDTAVTDEDTPIAIAVLANDRDVDLGDTPAEQVPTISTHSIIITTPPAHGTAVVQVDGTVLYTPANNYHGPDSFSYKINDSFLDSNIAQVNITVVSVNDDPVVADDFFTAIKHNPPEQVFPNQQILVLANDQVNDPDPGEALTIIAVSDPPNGTAVIAPDGKSILYTPDIGYEGPDSFTYTVEDDGTNPDNLQATATVTIEVVNFIPTDISGTVWMDTDNDGLMEDHERRLAGIEVRLVGSSFRDSTPGVTPDVDLVTHTDLNGFYLFLDVEPGDYTIWQTQPNYLTDGKDDYNDTTKGFDTDELIVTGAFNDHYTISIPLLSTDNATKSLEGNNFGERGLDTAYINIAELLASTTSDGFYFAFDASGNALWHTKLSGWDGIVSCSAVLNPDETLTLSVYDGFQTHHLTLTNSGTPRYRIISNQGSAGYLIRIEGSAEDFDLFAAASGAQQEGEADFVRGVDAIMNEIGSA